MTTATTQLFRTTMPSPVGELTLVADDTALRSIAWGDDAGGPTSDDVADDTALRSIAWGDDAGGPTSDDVADVRPGGHPVLTRAVEQLEEYFAGTRTEFDVPLAPEGTPFQQQVWLALRSIPYGQTISYGEQAARIGDRRRARAVGAANGRNPLPIVVPCHRVVGSNGHLTGFGGGIENKAWLLDHERRVSFGA